MSNRSIRSSLVGITERRYREAWRWIFAQSRKCPLTGWYTERDKSQIPLKEAGHGLMAVLRAHCWPRECVCRVPPAHRPLVLATWILAILTSAYFFPCRNGIGVLLMSLRFVCTLFATYEEKGFYKCWCQTFFTVFLDFFYQYIGTIISTKSINQFNVSAFYVCYSIFTEF